MKKYLKVLLVIVLFMCIGVKAKDYSMGDLIPVSDTASVEGDVLSYKDISYGAVDSEGYTNISFGSITNISTEKKPIYVSIDVLLFDSNKKNIGFVSYCSKYDVDSDYNEFTLKSGESSNFSIKLIKKYFVEGKSSNDVKYISVMDDNKYCRVGGYTKYNGLTIDEVNKGSSNDKYNDTSIKGYINKIDFSNFNGTMFIYVVIALVIFFIIGIPLNNLSGTMTSKTSILTYLPIGDIYVILRLAFGKIIGIVGFILSILSIYLYFTGSSFLFMIMIFIILFGLVLDIFKLISKKYDLLYLGKDIYNGVDSSIKDKFNINNNSNNTNNVDNSNKEEVLDLSYNSNGSNFTDADNKNSDNTDSNTDKSEDALDLSYGNGGFTNIGNNNKEKDNNDNNQESGNSDLSNMFR